MGKYIDRKFYYKGWHGFAPVWIADPHGECEVRARWWWLGEILLDLSLVIALLIMRLSSEDLMFSFYITDKDWRD